MSESSKAQVGFEILRAIRRILRKVTEHSHRLSREGGVTLPQLLCLKAIEEAPDGTEMTVAGVSRQVRLSAPTVSRILDRLEKSALVERSRSPRDRRRVCLTLTELGRKRLRALPRPLHEEFLARLATLSVEEQRVLLASLHQIVAMMEAEKEDAAPLLSAEMDPAKGPVRE